MPLVKFTMPLLPSHPPFFSFSSFSWGLTSRAFVLLVRTQIRHFHSFRPKKALVAGDKGTVKHENHGNHEMKF